MSNYHGSPLLIGGDETARVLRRVVVGDTDASEYNEDAIRNLAFDHPECLPMGEIDTAYLDPIPVCKELSTPAGPIDAVLITRTGRLVVVEAKLWKNPEARRKVIGQILDYAKELKRWGYNDLQREVARATGLKGNVLYQIAKDGGTELDEPSFVDTVAQSLKRGQFLLLVIGDGIREGAASIATFLQGTGTLEYTLGMVEMALYHSQSSGLFVQPRVLAKTEIIERTVFEIRDDRIVVESAHDQDDDTTEESENAKWYREFWTELIQTRLTLDDPQQPMANPTRTGNIYFPMPPNGGQAWVAAYFIQAKGNVGVYLKLASGEIGERFAAALEEEREEIQEELGMPIGWTKIEAGTFDICHYRSYGNGGAKLAENREEILNFLAETINKFVNVFRPRLQRQCED